MNMQKKTAKKTKLKVPFFRKKLKVFQPPKRKRRRVLKASPYPKGVGTSKRTGGKA